MLKAVKNYVQKLGKTRLQNQLVMTTYHNLAVKFFTGPFLLHSFYSTIKAYALTIYTVFTRFFCLCLGGLKYSFSTSPTKSKVLLKGF